MHNKNWIKISIIPLVFLLIFILNHRVIGQCTVTFSSINTSGNTFEFSNTTTGQFTKSYWDFGDFTIDSMSMVVNHEFPAPGRYKVCLVLVDSAGMLCGSDCKYVVVGNPESNCKASYIYKIIQSGSNYLLWLINTSQNYQSFVVNFDDGTSSSLSGMISHQFQDSGYYNICLTAIGSSNCIDAYCHNIQIGTSSTACDARFSYTINGTTASFNDLSVGNPTRWYWELGDGSISFDQNPVKVYNNYGFYTVKLSILNELTGCLDVKTNKILIGTTNDDCLADFLAINKPGTDSIYFINQSQGVHLYNITWNFGDGSAISHQALPKHLFPEAGFYNVCLSVGSLFGCNSTSCKTIYVGSSSDVCHADFNYNINNSNNQVTFFTKSLGDITSYKWYFGDGDSSNLKNPLHNYNTSNFFLVKHKVKTLSGKTSTKIELLNINTGINTLQSIFVYESGSEFNKANSYPVSYKGAAFGDPARVSWNFGDGTIDSTTNNPIHYYEKKDTTYRVCYTVKEPKLNQVYTYCSNVFVRELTQTNNYLEKDFIIILYPNPTNKDASILFSSENNENAEIWISDLSGKTIHKVFVGKLTGETHQFNINTENLKPGVYFVNLKKNGIINVSKLIVY